MADRAEILEKLTEIIVETRGVDEDDFPEFYTTGNTSLTPNFRRRYAAPLSDDELQPLPFRGAFGDSSPPHPIILQ